MGFIFKALKPGSKKLYLVSFSFVIGFFIIMLFSSANPENEIVGRWEEIKWEYEKVDKDNGDSLNSNKSISEKIKREITRGLIIHEAEVWQFNSNGGLLLAKETGPLEQLDWKLKGRGHILKLKHETGQIEYYNLYHIDQNKMILYFDSDIHAKGIVKMIFRRI